jgi:Fe-S cluster assembly ATP-binding protein
VSELLSIDGLEVEAQGRKILKGIDLVVGSGEIHALMGPNGSGKSTLANTLLGDPSYSVTKGSIRYKGEDVTAWAPDARAKAGMFLAFQHPEAIPGVPVLQFLRQAMSARQGIDLSVLEVRMEMLDWMKTLGIDDTFGSRPLNEGFSGGERKRNEVLQLALLRPELAVLDETDSGLDIDALSVVANGVRAVRDARPDFGVLLVTHYTRVLELLEPDQVHVLIDGRIVDHGGSELAARLDAEGYEPWRT